MKKVLSILAIVTLLVSFSQDSGVTNISEITDLTLSNKKQITSNFIDASQELWSINHFGTYFDKTLFEENNLNQNEIDNLINDGFNLMSSDNKYFSESYSNILKLEFDANSLKNIVKEIIMETAADAVFQIQKPV